MADVLGIKVSLELNAIEAGKDLTSQINKIALPPIEVDLKIGQVLGKEKLDSINFTDVKRKFQDAFTVEGSTLTDLRHSMESIERILNTSISKNNVEKFRELSSTLSTLGKSFEVDNATLSSFEKMNGMLTEFNKLSKDAQDALVKRNQATAKGNVDDLGDKIKSDSRMSVEEFKNAITNQQKAVDRALREASDGNLKSITRYLDATEGLKQVVKRQLDTWSTLTEQTFSDGSKLGKLTVDIESNLKKMETAYESSVSSIRKYSTELHKAIDVGDIDKISGLQNVIGVFEKTRDKIKAEMEKSPFSKQMAEKFLGIDTMNKYLTDMANNSYDKGVSDKNIKKQTDEYIASVRAQASELDRLNKELKRAQVDGLGDYAEKLTDEVTKAKTEMSRLLKVDIAKNIFPDDIASRVDLKRQATDIANSIDEVTKMFYSKMDSMQNKKLEQSGLNKFLAEFKENAREIEALEKKLATALSGEQFDYASKMQSKVTALNEQQLALKESAKALAQYEKAMKDVQTVEKKAQDNIDLHNSYLENQSKVQKQKADAKELERQQKEDSKKQSQQLKSMSDAQKQYWQDIVKYENSIAKGYESIAKTLSKKQNDYIQAIADDNLTSADALKRSIEYWNTKKNEIMSEIKKTNFTDDFYNKINDVDRENRLTVGEFEGKLNDKLNNQALEKNKQKERALIDAYQKMSKNLADKENQLLKALSAGDMDQYGAFKKSLDEYKTRMSDFLGQDDLKNMSDNLRKAFAQIDVDNGLIQSENLAKINDKLKNKLIKDSEKIQKSLLSEFKNVSDAIALKEGNLVKAMARGDENSVQGFERTLDALYNKHKEVISKIKQSGLDDILKAQMDEINRFNSTRLGEVDGAIADKMQSEQLKKENKAVKDLLDEYRRNASELEKYKKELLTAGEGTKTESALKDRISTLEREQQSIKENVTAYEDYAQTLNKINSIQNKLDQNVALATDRNDDRVSSSTAKENEKTLAQITKEREKLSKALEKEQKALIDTYEKYAKKGAEYQKQYINAMVNDDVAKAEALEKGLDRYNSMKNNILKQITDKGLDTLYADRLSSINKDIKLDLDVNTAGMSDKLNKKELQESSNALREFVNEYDRLYKQLTNEKLKSADLSQKGRTIEAEAHKNEIARLKQAIDLHEKKAQSLKLSAKAQDEVNRINSHYDNQFDVGMSKVGQNIQVKTYKEFKKEQDEILARYKKLYAEQEKFNKALSTSTSTDVYKKNKAEIEALENQLKSLAKQLTSTSHKDELSLFNGDKAVSQSREVTQAIEKIRDEAKSLLAVTQQLEGSEFVDQSSLEKLKTAFTTLANSKLEGTVGDIREMNAQLSKTKGLLEQVQNTRLDKIWQSDRNIQLTGVGDQLAKFKKDFAGSLDLTSIRALEDSFQRLSRTMNKDSFSQGAKELTAQLKHARNEMDRLVVSSGKYNFFEDLYNNMRTFQLADLIADGLHTALYSIKDTIIEVDSAIANVRKVAVPVDVDSVDKLDSIKDKAIGIAKEVGMATADVVNSIADTIQNGGYAMEEAIEIARQTMMLANVGEMSAESATKGVVTMLSGFKLDPLKEVELVMNGVTKSTNELTNAMDMVNYVGNNFAISTEGILSAFQGGATVLQEYGVGLTDTVALITGANKTLQDPSVVK